MPSRYGLNTNILLRLAYRDHPQHRLIQKALRDLTARNTELCFTPQNVGEFWNVSTRPADRNGFGLLPEQASEQIHLLERRFTLLPENDRVYPAWIHLLQTYAIRGVQVHDAHLAAMLQVHDVLHLLTLNVKDFERFHSLSPVHPAYVQP